MHDALTREATSRGRRYRAFQQLLIRRIVADAAAITAHAASEKNQRAFGNTRIVAVSEQKANLLYSLLVPARTCAVSFVDLRGIRHTAEVQADSLYEAVVLAVRVFRRDPWIERLGPGAVLD